MKASRSYQQLEALGRRFQRARRLHLPGLTFERYLQRPDHYDACYHDLVAAWQRADVWWKDRPISLN